MCSTAPEPRRRVVQLHVAVAVPGQRGDAVAEARRRSAASALAMLARARGELAVGVAVDVAFDAARHDLLLAVVALGVGRAARRSAAAAASSIRSWLFSCREVRVAGSGQRRGGAAPASARRRLGGARPGRRHSCAAASRKATAASSAEGGRRPASAGRQAPRRPTARRR